MVRSRGRRIRPYSRATLKGGSIQPAVLTPPPELVLVQLLHVMEEPIPFGSDAAHREPLALELMDELDARGLVLDQDRVGAEFVRLVLDRPLEGGVVQAVR